jgi:hypothetical protein
VVWETPVSAAIERIDQCVASVGVVRNVPRSRQQLIVVDRSRAARAGLVKQAITAIFQKSPAPLAKSMFVEAEFGSHRLAWQSIRTSQDRAASLR